MNPRVRAACDLQVAEVREFAGLHDLYDGVVQDLSPAGVRAGLTRLGDGPRDPDAHDEAQLQATEAGLRAWFDLVEEHRRSPLPHLGNLDLACYDREYAPAEERDEARRRHLAAWPEAVDAAIESMDRVPAAIAAALLNATRGLAAGVPETETEALAAHRRLVEHVEHFAEHGDPDPSLGAPALAAVMGDPEGLPVDLGRLAERADAERDRLRALLSEAVERYRPGARPGDVIPKLLADHPSEPEQIYAEARAQIDEATEFTLARDLLPELGGQCNVGPAPESRRWAMAMMSWAAPHEADAPSWYYVTPPDPSWTPEEQEEWLTVFSRTTLPAITVHEVTPGHYAHGRMLRRVRGEVRSTLYSLSFVEGWAHYTEELFVEEGFRADDPRFTIGIAIEALIRVTRLASALGLHTGTMTLAESTARFKEDAFQLGPAAEAEANRAGYDPGYGRYTWGKLEILRTRDEARARWGKKYSHRRFHEALLSYGSPALGLLGNAIGGD
ncbi:MAG TPA: DUF885 family protein [Acidimicrobiales bacterium]|jgi:hypothetical protein|nr:DUF885 family protein [Acidimicrobiales bacterium]